MLYRVGRRLPALTWWSCRKIHGPGARVCWPYPAATLSAVRHHHSAWPREATTQVQLHHDHHQRQPSTSTPQAQQRIFRRLTTFSGHRKYTSIFDMADKALAQVLGQLKHSPSMAYNDANALLSKAKLALLKLNALTPSPSTPKNLLPLARETYEQGALFAIRARNPEAFTRYVQQLQPFYELPATVLPPSLPERNKVTGLSLLLLLTQGRYAEFHSELESLTNREGGGGDVEEDRYLGYPIRLERWLMEGSYDRVWKAMKSSEVPCDEYSVFSEVSTLSREVPFYTPRACLTFLFNYRFSRTKSAPRSLAAVSAPTQVSRSAPPSPSFSSTPRAMSSSSPTTVGGSSATATSTSPTPQPTQTRRAARPKIRAKLLSRIRSAMPGNSRRLCKLEGWGL